MNLDNKKSVYLNEVIYNAPKLLSLIDRENFSITYGCFDRTYWQWKFTDFPNARFQEGIYVFAMLYKNNFGGNIYLNKRKILEWLTAGIDYWCKIMGKDGSFNEAYPNEHSFVATAFSLFAVTESYLLCEEGFDSEKKDIFLRQFVKAGDWLIKNKEAHGVISNHIAGAVASLYNMYMITKDDKYKNGVKEKLKLIREYQSEEGWLKEYEGADIGYLTLSIYYLAKYFKASRDEKCLDILKKAIEFIVYFIHPDKSLGGEYGSRNTEFYFPAGFEILSKYDKKARAVADAMISSIKEKRVVGLYSIDSHNFIPLLSNYLDAYLNYEEKEVDFTLPYQTKEEFTKNFSDAGTFIKKAKKYYFIMNYYKGGVIKVFNLEKEKIIYSNCGYVGKLRNKKLITTQCYDRTIIAEFSDNICKFSTYFYIINRKVFSVSIFTLFRIFILIFGNLQRMDRWIKSRIVNVLIYSNKRVPIILRKEIKFFDDKIEITDELKLLKNLKILSLDSMDKFSSIHMGSSRYFQPQELEVDRILNQVDLKEFLKQKLVKLKTEVSPQAKGEATWHIE